jgi:hypothetical protein
MQLNDRQQNQVQAAGYLSPAERPRFLRSVDNRLAEHAHFVTGSQLRRILRNALSDFGVAINDKESSNARSLQE